jgi:putative ABC transport system permease protein
MKTPLAWHNLTHDRKRLLWAVAGIGFAVLLMFMQLGFRGAMFDSTIALPKRFDADLILLHPQRYTLTVYEKFPRRYLQMAESVAQVRSARPLWLENGRATWKRAGEAQGPPIRVLGFEPTRVPLLIGEVVEQAEALQGPETGLFDRRSKSDFGDVQTGESVEINGRTVRVVGKFSLGTDFADDGTFLVGDRTFNNLFYSHLPGSAGLDQIDLGLVRLEDGADVERARAALDALLPDDVLVLTKEAYLQFELSFWQSATPIGYVFALGTAMGFIVGTIICYQILFADIADHLREFATLRAMGYKPSYFVGLVFRQSLLLSVIGFLPGFAAAWGLYASVAAVTGLPMNLDAPRIALVFGLTAAMCVVAGLLTIQKVLTTDPAELF